MTRAEPDLCSAFVGQTRADRRYTVCAPKGLDECLPDAAPVFTEAAGTG
jgi:rubrerythrin